MTVASVMFATVVGLGAILWYSSRPDFVELQTFGDGKAMQEARAALESAGILALPSGNVLKVDSDQYAAAQTVIFQQGLTDSSSPSFSESLGNLVPDRDTRLQIIDEQKRLAAEAAVRSLDDVTSVVVTASKPKQGPFRSDDHLYAPSATASIRIRQGADFFQVAPHAAAVVASAVGISKQFVEVRDARTHRKWQFDPDKANSGNMNDFLALQKSMSDALTREAQSALDAVFPGKTLVTVKVELDNNWEKRREVLRPTEPVVMSDRTSKDTLENGLQDRGGDPSIASGINDGQESPAASGPTSKSKNETRDRTFDTNNGEREIGKLAPDVRRITAAVMIDEGDATLASRVEDIREVVMNITGWEIREDVAVKVFPFPEPEPIEAPAGPGLTDMLREWGPTIGQVLGVLLVLLFLRGMLKRADPVKSPAGAGGAGDVEEDLEPEEATRRIRSEIEKTISEDPAAISRLLESWLAEQKT